MSLFLLCACIGGDCFALLLEKSGAVASYVFNVVISAIALVLSVIFVFFPWKTGFVKAVSDEDNTAPALSAVRTYICFISLDASVVLSLMFYGLVYSESSVKYILIATPLIFAVAVVKYIIDIRKIGIEAEENE